MTYTVLMGTLNPTNSLTHNIQLSHMNYVPKHSGGHADSEHVSFVGSHLLYSNAMQWKVCLVFCALPLEGDMHSAVPDRYSKWTTLSMRELKMISGI